MSQQDLNDFADWLVANPNKKGTPQYDTIAKAFKELDAQINPKDTSFGSAFQSGIDAPLENMATTARMVGAEGTADTLSGLTDAPVNYESASDRFINPQEDDFTIGGFAPGYLPRAAVEQAGQVAGSLATRAGGAAAGGLVAGPGGAIAGALAGPALFEFAQQLGPVAAQRAANNGRAEPNWDDWTAAAATAGVSGALNSIGVKGFNGAGLLNRTLKEGITEGTQSVVEQTGSSAGTDAGLQIDPKQAIGEGIIGGTSASGVGVASDTVSAVGRGASNATTRIFNPEDGTPSDPEAAADLAGRLSEIAKANGYDLADIDKMSTKGARETVDKAHVQLAEELKQLAKDLKAKLQVTDDDPISVVLEKVMAQVAQREARNKTKNTVGNQEMDAVQSLTGTTAEGQQMMRLMRQMNELTELHNSGYQGGISRITDQFSPFGSNVGYDKGAVATERLLRPLVSGGAAIQTGGASLAGQAAITGAGRLIDKMTGRRSTVRRFIEQNKTNQGTAEPNMPSLREAGQAQRLADAQAAQLEEQRRQALALEGTQQNDPPKGFPGDQNASPQYTMEEGTGLTRRGVANALKVLRRTRPKLTKAIDTYQTMLETGQQSADLTPLIRAVKGLKKKYPQLFDDTQGETNDGIATPTSIPENPNIKRGIESNLKFAQDQINKVDADNNMSDFDKIVAKDALQELSANLGSDPVASAEGILKKAKVKARKKPKIDEHVKPYVDRVKRQQKQAKKSELEYLPPPTETPEDLGFPRRDVDVQFMKDRDTAYDLRNRIDSLLGYVFDTPKRDKNAFMKKIMEEGAKRIEDPDGRLTISYINAGNFGDKGLSPEQVEQVAPFLVDFFNFVQSTPDNPVLGSFTAREDSQERVVGGDIEVVDIDQPIGAGKMHIYQFMDTVFHELGHSIEAKSNLRAFLTQLSYLRGPYDPKLDPLLEDGMTREGFKQAVKASKSRRAATWEHMYDALDQYEKMLGFRPLKLEALRQDIRDNIPVRGGDIFSVHTQAMQLAEDRGQIDLTDNMQLEQLSRNLYNAIQYLYRPAELGADAVAFYMQKPSELKKLYPELAKMVRAAVNDSDVSKYISFHSLVGLLGASGVIAAVQAAINGEDDEDLAGVLKLLNSPGVLQQASI